MPGCCCCWGELGSLGLEPKRFRDVDDDCWTLVDGSREVVEKAVADVAVRRRVAMVAVFMLFASLDGKIRR